MKGFVSIVVGGFLVGFGTAYAGGCTSGHAIAGLAEASMTLETGIADRQENMHAFTIAALTFLLNTIAR